MKFIHIADLHLDTLFANREEQTRKKLQSACLLALKRAVDLAIQESVNAFVVAGDLFDSSRFSWETEIYLIQQVERLKEAEIPFLYASGNHDPSTEVGKIDWPSNTILFLKAEPLSASISDSAGNEIAVFHGAGHEQKHEERNLASAFPQAPKQRNCPHIGILHTQIISSSGSEAHAVYAPSTVSELKSKDYDYWALGHIHLRHQVDPSLPAYYSGNPQGRHPNERGLKGAKLVELRSSKSGNGFDLNVKFVPLGEYIWEQIEIGQLTEVDSLQQLTEKIASAIDGSVELRNYSKNKILLRVQLTGQCPLFPQLTTEEDRQAIEVDLLRRLGLFQIEIGYKQLLPQINLAQQQSRKDILGHSLQFLDSLRADPSKLSTLCPKPLATKLDNTEQNEYLQSLLSDLSSELCLRMHKPTQESS